MGIDIYPAYGPKIDDVKLKPEHLAKFKEFQSTHNCGLFLGDHEDIFWLMKGRFLCDAVEDMPEMEIEIEWQWPYCDAEKLTLIKNHLVSTSRESMDAEESRRLSIWIAYIDLCLELGLGLKVNH